jgi:NADH-quinone oxidoreductase subunit H
VAYLTLAERKVIGYMQAASARTGSARWGCSSRSPTSSSCCIKEVVVPAKSSRFLFVIAPLLSIVPASLPGR